MLIHLHELAAMTPKTRAAIQASDAPASALADRFGTTEQTVCKCKRRDSVHDRSHAPHRLQTTPAPAQEAIAAGRGVRGADGTSPHPRQDAWCGSAARMRDGIMMLTSVTHQTELAALLRAGVRRGAVIGKRAARFRAGRWPHLSCRRPPPGVRWQRSRCTTPTFSHA